MNKKVKQTWADIFGNLTVEQAKSLNEAAKWYCEHEITTQTKGDE